MSRAPAIVLGGILCILNACANKRPPAPRMGSADSRPMALADRPEMRVAPQPEYLPDVFFDYDKTEIRPDAREALTRIAEVLRRHPTMRIRIEGHIDERYDSQTALAHSDRMANAAKNYLVGLGLDSSRIETVAYGKEQPFDTGHNEEAWAKNRRAHFVVITR